jgi:cytochrome c553
MKKLLLALLVLPLTQSALLAGEAQGPAPVQFAGAVGLVGDAAAGKMYWDSNLTACKNCHGGLAEGAFGPDLAGRGLNTVQVLRAVRQPWGIMPAFVGGQLSGQQAANIAAYFASLPKPAQPGPWRFEATAAMPAGQTTMINVGCGQCHGVTFNGPRGNLGAVNGDFDYFANLVYNHTTAIHQHRISLGGNPMGNVDMGNYNRNRMSEATLRQIYFWLRDDIGFRVPMQGQLSAGVMGATGVTYTLTVRNNGMQGKGLIAEGVDIHLVIPTGANVVAASGPGYDGIEMEGNDRVAEWDLDRSAPRDVHTYTITLSQAGTQANNLPGNITWDSPGPRQGPNNDVVNIAPAPLQ